MCVRVGCVWRQCQRKTNKFQSKKKQLIEDECEEKRCYTELSNRHPAHKGLFEHFLSSGRGRDCEEEAFYSPDCHSESCSDFDFVSLQLCVMCNMLRAGQKAGCSSLSAQRLWLVVGRPAVTHLPHLRQTIPMRRYCKSCAWSGPRRSKGQTAQQNVNEMTPLLVCSRQECQLKYKCRCKMHERTIRDT